MAAPGPATGATAGDDSSDDDIEVNLTVAAPEVYKSRHSYTTGNLKFVREELVADGEEENEEEDEPMEGGNYAEYTDGGTASSGGSSQRLPDKEQVQEAEQERPSVPLSRLEQLSAAAPCMADGFKALPPGEDAYVIDVRKIPMEVLRKVRMPQPGKHIRTGYDQNLDGMDLKGWRAPQAKKEEYFNYELDEESFVHYARRQKHRGALGFLPNVPRGEPCTKSFHSKRKPTVSWEVDGAFLFFFPVDSS